MKKYSISSNLNIFYEIRKCLTSLDVFPFKLAKFEFENQGIWTSLFKNKIISCFFQISSSLSLVWIHIIWIFKHVSLSIFKESCFCSRILAKIMLGREEGHQGPMTPFCTELKSGISRDRVHLCSALAETGSLIRSHTRARWRIAWTMAEGGRVSEGDLRLSGPCWWPTVSSSKEEDPWTYKGNWTRIRLEISPFSPQRLMSSYIIPPTHTK